MAVTYKLIETITVGSGGAASIAFASIPQTYTDLQLVISSGTTDASLSFINLGFNSSTSNFTSRELSGNGTSASTGTIARFIGFGFGTTAGTSLMNNVSLYIPNYTGSTYKSYSVDAVSEQNATAAYQTLHAGLWSVTSSITSIQLVYNAGNFRQHSSASLYGIKNS